MKEGAKFAILAQKWSKIAQQTPDTWGSCFVKGTAGLHFHNLFLTFPWEKLDRMSPSALNVAAI